MRTEIAARSVQTVLSYLLFGLIALGFMVAGAAIARLLTELSAILSPTSPAAKNVTRSIFDAIADAPAVLPFQRDKSRRRLSQSLGKGICGKKVNRYRTGSVSRPIPELDHMPVRHLRLAGR